MAQGRHIPSLAEPSSPIPQAAIPQLQPAKPQHSLDWQGAQASPSLLMAGCSSAVWGVITKAGHHGQVPSLAQIGAPGRLVLPEAASPVGAFRSAACACSFSAAVSSPWATPASARACLSVSAVLLCTKPTSQVPVWHGAGLPPAAVQPGTERAV